MARFRSLVRHAGVCLVALLVALLVASPASAQPLFRSKEPLKVTLTTNLRELIRERDSTELQWFGAEMKYIEEDGTERRIPVELRARGHFRRQRANCSFPPLFLRAERAVRDSSVLRGNPRVKIVTPCRPTLSRYQDYIFTEYQVYQAYAALDSLHHRTRLVQMTYADSAGRERPISVTTFFLETGEEVADEAKLPLWEHTGATWDHVLMEPTQRMSLFQYWIGNTDWSVSGLHNVILMRESEAPGALLYPVAYDFDWSGAVGTNYSTPNPVLNITSTRQRLHRGPCRTAAQWAPTIAEFQARRAQLDSIWSTPVPGQNPRDVVSTKRYLDDFWEIVSDPRKFKRAVIDECQREGN